MAENLKHKCMRCGYEWEGKKPNPLVCPKCRSSYWELPYLNGPRGGVWASDEAIKEWRNSGREAVRDG